MNSVEFFSELVFCQLLRKVFEKYSASFVDSIRPEDGVKGVQDDLVRDVVGRAVDDAPQHVGQELIANNFFVDDNNGLGLFSLAVRGVNVTGTHCHPDATFMAENNHHNGKNKGLSKNSIIELDLITETI